MVAAESSLSWQAFQTLKTGGHTGTIKFSSGELTVNSGNVTGGSFNIDMPTIVPTGMEEGEMKTKLTKQLKGADFFDVEKYKDAEFTIAEVVKVLEIARLRSLPPLKVT